MKLYPEVKHFYFSKKSNIPVIIQKRFRKGIFAIFTYFYSFFGSLLKLVSLTRTLAKVGENIYGSLFLNWDSLNLESNALTTRPLVHRNCDRFFDRVKYLLVV